MQLYPKHQLLINNCYPEKEDEKRPKQSELSYLVFYASSRPVKLTKVGLYLEKKVEKDIARVKKQHNQVSLEILKSLIEACHRDLNLFSKYVVKIIDMMLETRDIEIIDLACEVFIVFADRHDGSTLGVDTELTHDYKKLLKKFASFCSNEDADEILKLQKMYIGQRALQAAVLSTALQASDFKTQLDLILPYLINALSKSKNPVNALAQSTNEDVDIKQSAIGHETLNTQTVEILAAKTTGFLFGKANGAAVKLILSPLFVFMESQNRWWPTNFAVSMMELALDSLQPQHRYLLVSEVLQQLESSKADSADYINEKTASLVSTLDAVLNANVPLVGISVTEVLNTLFTHLIKSVQNNRIFREKEQPPSSSNSNIDENGNVNTTLEFAIQHGLVHSIGGLASQTYYLNQLNDITGYMINKLRVPQLQQQQHNDSVDEYIDGLPAKEYRRVVLKCLDLVTTASVVKESSKEDGESSHENAHDFANVVTVDVWRPALGLLLDTTPETRVNFAATLVHYLEVTSENEIALEPYPKHLLSQHSDVMLVNDVHQTIIDWVQLPNFDVHDVNAIYRILTALARKFGADETIKTVPLIFQIQTLVTQAQIEDPARQHAVAAIVVEWLFMVGEFYRIDSLIQYTHSLKNKRIKRNQYSNAFSTNSDNVENTASFSSEFEEALLLESANTAAVGDNDESCSFTDTFVDKEKVVRILVNDGPLRDEDDVEGKELEAKLNAEWGTEAYENHDRTFRIRTSRNLSDLKAKLATPWANAEINRNESGKKTTISVENLKVALIGQHILPSSGMKLLTDSCLTKRPNEVVSDINSLLQSLSIDNHDNNISNQNIISLVNPPYK